MPRPSIDYLNARRALMPASGGKTYRNTNRRNDNDLDPYEQIMLRVDSVFREFRSWANSTVSAAITDDLVF
jgi:hypothetical protein